MATVAEKLHQWSLQELNLVTESQGAKIPNVEAFKKLTKGKNQKIWNYVINHVRSQATVDKVKRTLFLKKQLKEQEEKATYFSDNSMNNEKLKESLFKAKEKRKYLMCSLSTIEERIVSLDQNVRKTKDEIFQINQKTALLEHLNQTCNEKNSNLKKYIVRISSYERYLNAYQTKRFRKLTVDLSYDFLFENRTLYDENLSTMKDLVIISSNIFKKQFNQDDDNIITLKDNFQNNFIELKRRGFLLTDFVVLLKEMSRSDLQQFTTLNSQNLSVKEYMLKKSKESEAKSHLARLKCDFIYTSLSSKKSKEKIEKYHVTKSKASKDAMEKLEIEPNDFDYCTKFALLEIQAENDALLVSNSYLENYLKDIATKTEAVLKNIRQKKMHSEDSPAMELFYKGADLTYSLLYAFPPAVQKVTNYLTDLKLFVHEELFKVPFPKEKDLEELKECFSSERKQTWDYCAKTKLLESLFADNEMPAEVCRSLNIQPYENISILCEHWSCFKQKLHAEMASNANTCMTANNISVSETYSKILKMLENMRFCIEKGMLALTYGTTCSQKNKTLIQEWWNQNAQYIPPIEYEGKTLKMWIDILSVLTDFELQSHV